MKKVSVIIIAYNVELYIKRCVDSILNQKYDNFEIIIVDDGSTDYTTDILEKMSKVDERLIVIHQQNQGPNKARLTGFEQAKGEYLLFVDGDDTLEFNAIAELNKIVSTTEYDMVLFNANRIETDKIKDWKSYDFESIDTIDCLKEFLVGNINPNIYTKFIKKDFLISLDEAFYSDCSYGEDLATVNRWLLNNPKIFMTPLKLYNYYYRSTSITNQMNKRVLDVGNALKDIKFQLDKYSKLDKYRKYFDYMVYVHIFETKFLLLSYKAPLHKKIYLLYEEFNIDIIKNRFIKERINQYPTSLKLRIYLYMYKYRFGRLYDRLRSLK